MTTLHGCLTPSTTGEKLQLSEASLAVGGPATKQGLSDGRASLLFYHTVVTWTSAMLLQKLGPPWLRLPCMKYWSPGGKGGFKKKSNDCLNITKNIKGNSMHNPQNTSPLLPILTPQSCSRISPTHTDLPQLSSLLLLPLPWLWLNPSRLLASRIHCQMGGSRFSFEGRGNRHRSLISMSRVPAQA